MLKQDENHYTFIGDDLLTVDRLPIGVYTFHHPPRMEPYFVKNSEKFEFNFKLYDLDETFISHVLYTFEESSSNVGILLTGLKGSGKTITCKNIANQSGLPVIVLDASDIDYLSYFDVLSKQPVCFIIDEFEKVYGQVSSEAQLQLLNWMEGNHNKRNLIILTSNEKQFSQYFIDRPGRIRYIKNYEGLSYEASCQIIEDMLIDKSFTGEILLYLKTFSFLTIDKLKAVINEVNIHNIPPKEFANIFNVNDEPARIKIEVSNIYKGKKSKFQTTKSFTVDSVLTNLLRPSPIFQGDLNCILDGRENSFYFDEIKNITPAGLNKYSIEAIIENDNSENEPAYIQEKNKSVKIPANEWLKWELELIPLSFTQHEKHKLSF